MPKSKTEMMKRLYQQRKDAGLVEFRVWVSPADYRVLVSIMADIEYYRPLTREGDQRLRFNNPSS